MAATRKALYGIPRAGRLQPAHTSVRRLPRPYRYTFHDTTHPLGRGPASAGALTREQCRLAQGIG